MEVDEDVFVELDRDNNIVGIEIWRASELLIASELESGGSKRSKYKDLG